MTVDTLLKILAVIVLVIVGGLFSGSETGMYRLSRLRLRLGVEKKQLLFVLLGKVMRDSPGLLLSMLIGTNLANYIATAFVTLMLLDGISSEGKAELLATFITTPTLFVFSELIPKNIFFYRADYLMPRCAPLLFVFHKLMSYCGVVPVLKLFSRVFARLIGTSSSPKTIISDAREHHIASLLRETTEEGLLTSIQTEIINRLVRIAHIRLRAVMRPFAAIRMVSRNSNRDTLLAVLKKSAYTRLPVYDGSTDNIIGFINIYEALMSKKDFTNLDDFIRPIRKLAAGTSVWDAIDIMRKENHKIALVIRTGAVGGHRPIGLVTMKDLVEELLGELSEW